MKKKSKKHIRARCKWGKGKKIKYTYHEAEAAIKCFKNRKDRTEKRIYYCNHCDGHHITSMPKIDFNENKCLFRGDCHLPQSMCGPECESFCRVPE